MESEKLFFTHVKEADQLVMVSVKDSLISIFTTLNTEREAIDLMYEAQRQLAQKIIRDQATALEESAEEATKKLLDKIDKKFH